MSWLKEFARDGQVAQFAPDVADAIEWPYDVLLSDVLRDAGLLREDGVLAGWPELNGWLVGRAEKDRKRHRKDNPARSRSVGSSGGRTDGRTATFSAEPPGTLRGGLRSNKKEKST